MNFAGKEFSILELCIFAICHLDHYLKSKTFLYSHKTLDTTILISSDGIRMFFSFHNKTIWLCHVYTLSRTNLHWKIFHQHPSDAILKVVCTNVTMILKEFFHEIVQNVSLELILCLCINLLATSRA